MKTQKKKLEELKNLIDIQGQNGNWNYDNYMMGLYNGLEMARSVFTESEPVFRDKPERWLSDKPIISRIKLRWLKKKGNNVTSKS